MLGIIGEEQMRQCCINAAGVPASVAYLRRMRKGDTPALIEVAFAWLLDTEPGNSSPASTGRQEISDPFRVDGALADLRAGPNEPPVMVVLHLAQPGPNS